MGRSTKLQASENRERIIQVASSMYRAQGIGMTGISDVMKAAGMTQGGFYRHFASKDDLVVEACNYAFGQALMNWSQVANDASSKALDPLSAIVRYYLSDKPPNLTCPMIAFGQEVARRNQSDPLRLAFTVGAHRLLEVLRTASPSSSSSEVERTLHEMVGAKMLALATS